MIQQHQVPEEIAVQMFPSSLRWSEVDGGEVFAPPSVIHLDGPIHCQCWEYPGLRSCRGFPPRLEIVSRTNGVLRVHGVVALGKATGSVPGELVYPIHPVSVAS